MSLATTHDLTNQPPLADDISNNKQCPIKKIVVPLISNRQLSELETCLSSLSPAEIGNLLTCLSFDQASLVWELIESTHRDEIIWYLPVDLRKQLIGDIEPNYGKGQIHAYELVNGKLAKIALTCYHELAETKLVWIDLLQPSKLQRRLISQHYGLELPSPDELTDLEASARFYVEQNTIHIHSDFLLERDNQARSVPVAFVLHEQVLISMRNEELPIFRLQRLRARTQPGFIADGKDMLLELYSAEAEYSADALENIYDELETVSKTVLSQNVSDEDAARILSEIAEVEDLNGRIRRNMLDTQRAVSFLLRRKLLTGDQLDDAQQILRDIESLNSHTAFLFDKINFLMDATVGFININQNRVIKIFSVASVALLPPTLIASIYGMNFQFMPELMWKLGYPFALLLMITSVVIPYFYFRKKGWLGTR